MINPKLSTDVTYEIQKIQCRYVRIDWIRSASSKLRQSCDSARRSDNIARISYYLSNKKLTRCQDRPQQQPRNAMHRSKDRSRKDDRLSDLFLGFRLLTRFSAKYAKMYVRAQSLIFRRAMLECPKRSRKVTRKHTLAFEINIS